MKVVEGNKAVHSFEDVIIGCVFVFEGGTFLKVTPTNLDRHFHSNIEANCVDLETGSLNYILGEIKVQIYEDAVLNLGPELR